VVTLVGVLLARGLPANAAARFVIAQAAAKWKQHEDVYRDDITAIVIYLKDLLPILVEA